MVRSYRLVFRRRWRIFRIQGWRIPLPGGLELRLLGYWLACLALIALLGRLPLLGAPSPPLPPRCACSPCRSPPPGRSRAGRSTAARPHRALLGLFAWRLRPRALAALRRCPPLGSELAPLGELALAPDLAAPSYPRGRLRGPARLLLRYPVAVALEQRAAAWRAEARPSAPPRRGAGACAPAARPPLHSGKTLEVPAGRTVIFEGGPRVRPPHYFFWANLVLRTPSDAWAVYQLEGQSYPGLSESRKIEVGERLEALAYTLESDFQILRVARAFDAEAYVRRALSTLDPRHGHRERFAAPHRRAPRRVRAPRRPAPGDLPRRPPRPGRRRRVPRRPSRWRRRGLALLRRARSASRSRAASAPASSPLCARPRRPSSSACSAISSAAASARGGWRR